MKALFDIDYNGSLKWRMVVGFVLRDARNDEKSDTKVLKSNPQTDLKSGVLEWV